MSKWPIVPLASLCLNPKADIVDGPFGSNLKRDDYIPSGIPVLKIQNIKESGVVLKKMDYVTPKKFAELSRHSFRRGDIVITKLGDPLGIAAVVEQIDEGLIVADLVRIRVDESRVNTRYLAYVINSTVVRTWLNDQQKGTTRPRVSLLLVRAIPVPLPPLDEQKRIVAKLDEASELFARQSALYESRQEQLLSTRVSILDNLFSHDGAMVDLASICEVITDGDHQPPPKSDTGIPFITISCIDKTSRTLDLEAGFRVSPSYFDALQDSRKPRQGDVLLTVTGSYGIPVIVRDDRPFCFQRHIALLRPKPEISAEWLGQVLRTSSVRAQIEDGATGTAQKTLSLKALRALRVPQWSIERQLETSQVVRDLEVYLDASTEFGALRQELMTSLGERIISCEIPGAA